MSFGFPFLPTIDSESAGEIFLPASPRQLLESGKLNVVPIIAGVTSHEGIIALNGKLKNFLDSTTTTTTSSSSSSSSSFFFFFFFFHICTA
jgi:hypothetical protein